MLGVTADGNKIPPYILVLNRKTVPKENLCKDAVAWAPQKMHG
jgi:hypothetical protein